MKELKELKSLAAFTEFVFRAVQTRWRHAVMLQFRLVKVGEATVKRCLKTKLHAT